MIRSIGISILALALSGCLITGKVGDFITIKPSAAQLSAAAKSVVCQSFSPITFSGSKDTAETVNQVRGHNAAYRSFGCK